MKSLKYIIPFVLILTFISCSEDDSDDPISEVEGLLKVQEFVNDDHIIELFTESGALIQGYNNITIRVKENATGSFVENATLSWKPVMHMTTKMHSCPKSELLKVAGKKTVYNGYIIFQMAENLDEGWDLTINYTIDEMEYSVVDDIAVPMSDRKTVSVFMGSDMTKYILALVEPQNPQVAVNDITVGLFKMESMMDFPVVQDYTIMLDPRMPSMGNHTSPNNEDLSYDSQSEMYNGKLSLTMSGYWKLNLILKNTSNEVLKGEEVTESNDASSLYLELEF